MLRGGSRARTGRLWRIIGGRLLIGNFGDGHIDAYDVQRRIRGRLRDAQQRALNIDESGALHSATAC